MKLLRNSNKGYATMAPDKETLHDLLGDLTTQAYFVAWELAPDNPAELWRDVGYAIMATVDAKDVEYLNTTHVGRKAV